MTSAYRDQLRALVEALEVRPESRFTWFGRPVAAPAICASLEETLRHQMLRTRLRDHLYEHFYRTGGPVPIREAPAWPRRVDALAFLHALSSANQGKGSWQPGWKLERDPDVIGRSGLRLHVADHERRADTRSPEGGAVDLWMPKELFEASPGYYMALGDEPLRPGERIVRLYWNATCEGALQLVEAATGALNRLRIPFQLKALSDPEGYQRRDAVVLYVGRDAFEAVGRWVAETRPRVAAGLKDGVPALTKPLAEGIGLAEDPPAGGSFGLNRCARIAEGLIHAHSRGCRTTSDRIAFLEASLQAAGVQPDAPHLESPFRDAYELPSVPVRPCPPDSDSGRSPGDLGIALARALCDEAIWSRDRCNWIGPLPDDGVVHASETARTGALGGDVYGGTSGIAFFLAHAAAVADDSRIRDTAIGAVRQAADRFGSRASGVVPLGFYSGWTGVALAAAAVGLLLREPQCSALAAGLIDRFGRRTSTWQGFDFISGRAGAIPALLRLASILEDESCARLATQLGNELLLGAKRDRSGCSWEFAGTAARGRLIGISHGAAGAACALLELYERTREVRYRDAALEAVRFERRHFDVDRRDWRDSRSSRGRVLQGPPVFQATWCHGAPGIALTRLRGYQITGEAVFADEARAGVEATRRAVETALSGGAPSAALCHGTAGNADVLLSVGGILDAPGGDDRALATRTALRVGLDALRSRARWSRRPLGLMLGTAGVGYLCLRASDPGIPSLLLAGGCDRVSAERAGSSRPATRPSV